MSETTPSIITKRGDSGSTDILFGTRTNKDDVRIHAVGLVDELTASIGLVRVEKCSEDLQTLLGAIQESLIGLMGLCSVMSKDYPRYLAAGFSTITDETVQELEELSQTLEKALPPIKTWVIPGAHGVATAARLDYARAVCRRAERYVVSVWHQGDAHVEVASRYLNRLSDCLWILARVEEMPA